MKEEKKLKKLNKKKIIKDVIIAFAMGFLSLMAITGAITLEIAQVPYKFIFVSVMVSAIVVYGIMAVFKGFSFGYIINSEENNKNIQIDETGVDSDLTRL